MLKEEMEAIKGLIEAKVKQEVEARMAEVNKALAKLQKLAEKKPDKGAKK
jgi:hypothetical protein